MDIDACKRVAQGLIDTGDIDFLDVSLWDCLRRPVEERHQNKTLLEHVQDLERKSVRITVAGKISTAKDVQMILDAGIDFVAIGRAAILHHDYPNRMMADPDFVPVSLPVSGSYLKSEGLGDAFVQYMKRWKGFVAD